MASAYVLEKFQRKCHIFKVCVPPYLIESHLKSFGAMSPWSLSIKAFGFVQGYNHAVGAVKFYHIKNSMHKKTKKSSCPKRFWYLRDIGIYFINNTYLCTWSLWPSVIIFKSCPFSPRGFCCGTSKADPQTTR